MSNLGLIQPQRRDFDTQQTCDWLDPCPAIGVPGFGGVLPGGANVGVAALIVAAVGPDVPIGAHVVTVVAVAGGQTYLSVAGPDGAPTGQGVAGLPLDAGGLVLTLAQAAGQAQLALGDAFAVAVVTVPVDITGLRFDLDARIATGAATVAMRASTADAMPTIVVRGPAGVVAMARLKPAQAATPVGDFPYSILATDPATGLTVCAFYGIIHHRAVATQLGT